MVRYEANADFKLPERSPGNDSEVIIISFPHKLNIVTEGWLGLGTRLEYYKPLKKASILPSKGAHFEKFAAARNAAKSLSIFLAALRAAQHGLYTSNLLPTPMVYIKSHHSIS